VRYSSVDTFAVDVLPKSTAVCTGRESGIGMRNTYRELVMSCNGVAGESCKLHGGGEESESSKSSLEMTVCQALG
jgi:hypothetical protein